MCSNLWRGQSPLRSCPVHPECSTPTLVWTGGSSNQILHCPQTKQPWSNHIPKELKWGYSCILLTNKIMEEHSDFRYTSMFVIALSTLNFCTSSFGGLSCINDTSSTLLYYINSFLSLMGEHVEICTALTLQFVIPSFRH